MYTRVYVCINAVFVKLSLLMNFLFYLWKFLLVIFFVLV